MSLYYVKYPLICGHNNILYIESTQNIYMHGSHLANGYHPTQKTSNAKLALYYGSTLLLFGRITVTRVFAKSRTNKKSVPLNLWRARFKRRKRSRISRVSANIPHLGDRLEKTPHLF